LPVRKKKIPKRLKNKRIVLGVTGSVAAYKTIDLIRRLKDEEASVDVIMTDASQRFITSMLVEAAGGVRVYTGLFDDPMAHVELTREADLFIIAPATANAIGKFAHGVADDLLSTALMSYRGVVLAAPAMNWRMYESLAFQKNLRVLKTEGLLVEVPPEKGMLACGEEGVGRMAAVEDIIEAAVGVLTRKDFAGKRIVVTAGPTREPLDAVRFLSNRSSGKMGYALAKAALRRGADVVLITGPSALNPPKGVEVLKVETAAEMHQAVMRSIEGADVLIMAAAVADFAPRPQVGTKLEKSAMTSLELESTPDILAGVGGLKKRPVLVGFAAEAGPMVERAERKLRKKGADMLVFNDVTEQGAGFDVDTNRIAIISAEGTQELPLMSKEEAAAEILDRISRLCA
jgi:phosphopantothenoylcysteine decarboxylase/phosphopantothenate--cysteine ligase